MCVRVCVFVCVYIYIYIWLHTQQHLLIESTCVRNKLQRMWRMCVPKCSTVFRSDSGVLNFILFVCKHKIYRIVGGSVYAEFLETMTALVQVFLGTAPLLVLWGAFCPTRYSAWNFTAADVMRISDPYWLWYDFYCRHTNKRSLANLSRLKLVYENSMWVYYSCCLTGGGAKREMNRQRGYIAQINKWKVLSG